MSESKPNPKERETRLLEEVQPWHETVRQHLRELLRPEALPPVESTSKPVKVTDLWGLGVWNGQLRRSELLSALVHAAVVLALVSLPYLNGGTDGKPAPKTVEFTSWGEIGHPPIYPRTGRDGKSGGGGGGGERNPLKASHGRLPRWTLDVQLAPPAAVNRNPNPLLAAEPTIMVRPDMILPSPDVPAYGDPNSTATIPSSGPGSRGGIGTGSDKGVGPGRGPGTGPGEGGGCCEGAYRVGTGVSPPVCIYCPQPEYSEEARKVRYQGKVGLWAVVDADGRVREVRVTRSAGMGLDEQAMATVQSWRFKPAERNARAVPVYMTIEIDFHLY